jgi:peptidyl-prolyl cis-trans isomerase B (cyclophilin B)
VASSKTRQRKLARAKVERQLVRRAAKVRRTRQVQAAAAAGVVAVLAIAIGLWAGGVFSSKPAPPVTETCAWTTPANASGLDDVGRPPTSGEPRTGTEPMTLTTDQGAIQVSLDLAKAPCAASSLHYLAGKNFFNNSTCRRLTTGGSGSYLLQCGYPSQASQTGPAYTFPDENLPAAAASASPSGSAAPTASASPPASAAPSPSGSAAASAAPSATATVIYAAGTVAMYNTGPDANGSQFFIVYKDSVMPPNYSVIGTVTSGLDVVNKIATGGAVDSSGASTSDGAPKIAVTVQSLTVGTEPSASASTQPSASTSPSASPTGAANS